MKFLVTAGPTREHIDDIRFLSNSSSGRMGVQCSEAALARGHEVVLIHGPLRVSVPKGVEPVPIVSAEDLFKEVMDRLTEVDVLIMTAAVADYRPVERIHGKRKKGDSQWTLELTRTRDVLAACGERVSVGEVQTRLVGFALEPGDGRVEAERKLREKHCSLLALNHPDSLDASTGSYTLLSRDGVVTELPDTDKRVVAEAILDWLEQN